VRQAGTDAETQAAQYGFEYLRSLGYDALITDFDVPNGLPSHNVVAVKQGSSPLTIVVGGHMDTKKPSPGGNDNASGSAAVLELARDLAGGAVVPTVVFVLFGNEEMIDSNPDHHHYGSRAYLQQMTALDRANTVGMISLDMIGYGSSFVLRTMGRGPREMRDMLKAHANSTGVNIGYLADPSKYGYSDHEPFELAGYPAVWVEWRDDPVYHTVKDTYEHCRPSKVQAAGELVLSFLTDLDLSDLQGLAAAKH
jgi:aminopeptidase YwaD